MATGRPWRAIAYRPDPLAPNGRKRDVTGRTSATTEQGLNRFVNQHEAAGDVVDRWRVSTIEDHLGETA
jgi:hypothetical protein